MTTTFKERNKPDTKVSVLLSMVPKIEIHPDALTRMQIYVENVAKEVGWLGTAYRDAKTNTILIRDVFLFDQEVHATTTEITPEGLSEFAQELLLQPDGMDIWNNMKMWGHSHVNMGVSPSGQDDKQMETFQEGGHDWFIRLIANKSGDMKIDLYDYETGIVFTDLPWSEGVDQEVAHIKAQITELYKQLNQRKESLRTAIEEPIKQEIKVKVREKSYGYTQWQNQPNRPAGYGYPATTNQQYGNQKSGFQTNLKGVGESETFGATTTKKKTNGGIGENRPLGEVFAMEPDDLIHSEDDLAGYFHITDIIQFGQATSPSEILEELEDLGYQNYFSDADVVKIYKFSEQYCRYYGLLD